MARAQRLALLAALGLAAATAAQKAAALRAVGGVRAVQPTSPDGRVVQLRRGRSVAGALRALRRQPAVAAAAPDVLARAAGFPNDPGGRPASGGWSAWQWDLLPGAGVDAPRGWAAASARRRPGGQGVTVAVVDTGVAYANRGRFRRSPDFGPQRFVRGWDVLTRTPAAYDRNGHGTFVASILAANANDRVGFAGLAYRAKIMPVRVLDERGEGSASTIAAGVRWAVEHGARIVNVSVELPDWYDESGRLHVIQARDIPDLIAALRLAERRGALVVAASGNDGTAHLSYPARYPTVLSVGATTEHGCLAAYSDTGANLDLVAPGGGPDADRPSPACQPATPGRSMYALTFDPRNPGRFLVPDGWYGTSMAAPHVSGIAALVLGARVLGPRPSPAQLRRRLTRTARDLGARGYDRSYGAGLVDAGRATNAR
jgi:serine protease